MSNHAGISTALKINTRPFQTWPTTICDSECKSISGSWSNFLGHWLWHCDTELPTCWQPLPMRKTFCTLMYIYIYKINALKILTLKILAGRETLPWSEKLWMEKKDVPLKMDVLVILLSMALQPLHHEVWRHEVCHICTPASGWLGSILDSSVWLSLRTWFCFKHTQKVQPLAFWPLVI